MVSRVNWRSISQQDFDEIVDALLVRHLTRDGVVAHALDGRGGDGGIDVATRSKKTDQIIHIYQVKYFPEGMSAGHIHRRQQVRDSLDSAITNHNPAGWTLVMPRKITAPERKAVRSMRKGRRISIKFMGPPELDELLALYPHLEKRLLRDYALEIVTAMNRPEATLRNSADLASELFRMHKIVDSQSNYWGKAFGIGPDGTTVETIYAKRPDAPDIQPLKVKFGLEFSEDQAGLRDLWQQGMNFGLTKPLHLPSSVVTFFKQEGAPWFQEEGTGGEVTISPVPTGSAQPAIITLRSSSGQRVGGMNATLSALDRGLLGVTAVLTAEGGLRQEWKLPFDHELSGDVSFEFDGVGQSATSLLRIYKFISALDAASEATLVLGSSSPITVNIQGEVPVESDKQLVEFIEDLALIEKELDVTFALPAGGVKKSDRVWSRVFAQMLRGFATPVPEMDGFSFELTGGSNEHLLSFLENEESSILVRHMEFAVSILGQEVVIGQIYVHNREALIVDGRRHAAALRSGAPGPYLANVRAASDLPFIIYSPERLKDKSVKVIGWKLGDIPEVPGLARLIELRREDADADDTSPETKL